jgi:hypothetical protein
MNACRQFKKNPKRHFLFVFVISALFPSQNQGCKSGQNHRNKVHPLVSFLVLIQNPVSRLGSTENFLWSKLLLFIFVGLS